ncbi:MAG: RibD family protein, partial [Paracoccus sp. (in: a-proteobacteria)]|nr:RibD family protein [Paracoccus sp. (in: a-proteobacteria)]
FISRITRGRPMVTLKLALSLDGKIATEAGESQWITGPEARRHVHALRLSHDAIMVGGGTARADRPSLNVRGFGSVRQPVRVVVSRSKLPDLPPEGRDFGPLWQMEGDPGAITAELGARGLTRVLCEGGGVLAASVMRADLVDELAIYSAGLLIGADGRAALGALGVEVLANLPRFDLLSARRIGGDHFQHWIRRTNSVA